MEQAVVMVLVQKVSGRRNSKFPVGGSGWLSGKRNKRKLKSRLTMKMNNQSRSISLRRWTPSTWRQSWNK